MAAADFTATHQSGWIGQPCAYNLSSLQDVGTDDPNRRVLFRPRNHALQTLGENPIVSEYNLAILAQQGYLPQSGIVIGECAQELWILEDPYSRIFGGILTSNFGRSIGTAVIDNDVFPMWIGLTKNGLDAFREISRSVVHGSNYAH